jgi:hypothetical protein
MSKRLAVVVPAILAACVVVAVLSSNSGRAENACLSGPNATAPEGRWWYYRLDRSTGRRCWYLGVKGVKVRQATPRVPLPTRRAAARPAEADPAVSPVAQPAETPGAASAAEVVTLFSTQWPHLPAPADTVGHAPTSLSNSYAEETAPTPAQEDDMPLVWPVHTAAELAAAKASAAPAIRIEHMLALLAAALILAGITGSLLYTLSSIQRRRSPPRKSNVASNEAQIPLRPSVRGNAGYRRADGAHKPVADAVRKPLPARRAATLPREPHAPSDAVHGVEMRLRELIDALRRPAA